MKMTSPDNLEYVKAHVDGDLKLLSTKGNGKSEIIAGKYDNAGSR
jgi:hypothetical protein